MRGSERKSEEEGEGAGEGDGDRVVLFLVLHMNCFPSTQAQLHDCACYVVCC